MGSKVRKKIKRLKVKMSSNFKASMEVTELLAKSLENYGKDLARRCIMECGVKYGFDGKEAIASLELEDLRLVRKAMPKKGLKEKVIKVDKEKVIFPLPFTGEVSELCCEGLSYNRGLFTQCRKMRMEKGAYCKVCQEDADKNASGMPSSGSIKDRKAKGLYEFVDSKGRKPIRYIKVLEKLKLSEEKAREEAGKLKIELSEEHFLIEKKKVVKKEASRGRPKKEIVEVAVTDLFAHLPSEELEAEALETKKSSEETKKSSEEAKASKKAALEQERAAKKAALEQEKAAKKVALEQEKAAKRAALEQEKAALEQEKAAKKAQEKAAKKKPEKKEQEKAEKKEQEKAEKKKPEKEQEKPEKEQEPTPKKVSVTRVTIDGTEYMKSSENVLYNATTKEAVGVWNPLTKEIDELPED